MENKINIAELLKDCPQGMELDCTLFEGLEFDGIVDNEYLPIRCRVKNPNGGYNFYNFTKYGCWLDTTFAKCVIFPKGKTTWEGFVPPCKFKKGDIVISTFGDIHLLRTENSSYCAYRESWEESGKLDKTITTSIKVDRLATEEEKQKLFDTIKANGYKWNEETKTLEKLVEPKFKVGDRVKRKEVTIVEIDGEYYTYVNQNGEPASISIKNQDNWELVPNKFDITTLKPFDKVLVRNTNKDYWRINMFGYISKGDKQYFMCTANSGFYQCIPYEGNEHLLGTANDCDKFYKNW